MVRHSLSEDVVYMAKIAFKVPICCKLVCCLLVRRSYLTTRVRFWSSMLLRGINYCRYLGACSPFNAHLVYVAGCRWLRRWKSCILLWRKQKLSFFLATKNLFEPFSFVVVSICLWAIHRVALLLRLANYKGCRLHHRALAISVTQWSSLLNFGFTRFCFFRTFSASYSLHNLVLNCICIILINFIKWILVAHLEVEVHHVTVVSAGLDLFNTWHLRHHTWVLYKLVRLRGIPYDLRSIRDFVRVLGHYLLDFGCSDRIFAPLSCIPTFLWIIDSTEYWLVPLSFEM